ncbi:MAG TPA: SBBP repeat-containing protein, partial [Actinomycetes bacterium]|nr:SBBP repeat-containing protein [Actinomycetes bacterium]
MSRVRVAVTLLTCCIMALTPNALAAQPTLDPTFSNDGKLVLRATTKSDVTDVEVHGGDVYAAGWSFESEFRQMMMTRVNTAGELDTGFGRDGFAFAFPGDSLFGTGLTVDSDGGVLVVGQSAGRSTVARLTASGHRDLAFSGNGYKTLPAAGTKLAFPPDLVIDSVGRIIVGATVVSRHGFDVHLYRLLPNGDRDSSFSGDGVRTIDFSQHDWMDALAVDSRDRVILGTDVESSQHPNAPSTIIRLRRNGTFDAT